MTEKKRPGLARLEAQEGIRQPSPVRDISEKLDEALSNGHDPDETGAALVSTNGNGASLAIPGKYSETGLDLRAGLSFDEWQSVGFKLRRIHKAWKWWVGDWLNYGERAYGEGYSQAMDELGLDYQQAADCAYVARHVDLSRRRETLSWSHHREVAPLDKTKGDELLAKAETEGWDRKTLREVIKGPKAPPEPGSTAAMQAPLLRYCPTTWSTAQIVTGILRVCFPDARTALDTTYGAGNFWDGSAHVTVKGLDLAPGRSPGDAEDFRDLTYSDNSFDVVAFDPPHLADGGEDSIMAQRYGTYDNDELEETVRQGVREAWRVARLGIIVKVTDHVHGQEFVSMTDWVRWGLAFMTEGNGTPMPPYEMVYQIRESPMTDPKWGEQASAYNNGSTYLVFRKGSQKHERRSADA